MRRAGRKILHSGNGRPFRKQTEGYSYIPFRYIAAVIIAIMEVIAVIGIVAALCYYVPFFYLAAWATEISCVIRIIASDDNPNYKVPWLLFVLIIPIAGFMLYFMFYSRMLQKRFIKRLDALKSHGYEHDDRKLLKELKAEKPHCRITCRDAHGYCSDTSVYRFQGGILSPWGRYASPSAGGS